MTGLRPGDDPGAPRPAPVPSRGSRTWWAGWLPLPTGRAAALAAAAALAVLVLPTSPGIGLPLSILAVAVAVDAWLAPAPWQVAVSRSLPPVVPLQGSAEVVWRMANPSRRRVAIGLADDLAPSLGASMRRVWAALPGHGRTRTTATLSPTRRGTFRPTQVTVRVVGPLGLGFRQADRHVPGRVEVHPSFRSREAAELRIRRARILEQGLRSVRGRGGGTEFETLREYVQGDEFRHVDWAATARAGRPIVRTYRAERNQLVIVLLDTGRVTAGLVDGVPRLDHGMDAVMGLATVATRLGDRVGLVAFGADVRAVVPPRRASDQLRVLSRAMHELEPELAESAYGEAFKATLARFRRRALLVIVTELAAEAVQETLVPALPLVAREHAVVVASVQDPAVEGLRRAEITEPRAAYRAAAAAGVLAEREAVATRLRGLGARVVDAAPGELAGRLADTYLDVKATGGL